MAAFLDRVPPLRKGRLEGRNGRHPGLFELRCRGRARASVPLGPPARQPLPQLRLHPALLRARLRRIRVGRGRTDSPPPEKVRRRRLPGPVLGRDLAREGPSQAVLDSPGAKPGDGLRAQTPFPEGGPPQGRRPVTRGSGPRPPAIPGEALEQDAKVLPAVGHLGQPRAPDLEAVLRDGFTPKRLVEAAGGTVLREHPEEHGVDAAPREVADDRPHEFSARAPASVGREDVDRFERALVLRQVAGEPLPGFARGEPEDPALVLGDEDAAVARRDDVLPEALGLVVGQAVQVGVRDDAPVGGAPGVHVHDGDAPRVGDARRSYQRAEPAVRGPSEASAAATISASSARRPTPGSSSVEAIGPSAGPTKRCPQPFRISTLRAVTGFDHISGFMAGAQSTFFAPARTVAESRSSPRPMDARAIAPAVAGATSTRSAHRARETCSTLPERSHHVLSVWMGSPAATASVSSGTKRKAASVAMTFTSWPFSLRRRITPGAL